MSGQSHLTQILFLGAAIFAAFTGAWFVVGLANSGDAFPQGLALPMLPLLALSPAVTAWRLRKTDSTRAKIVAAATASLALLFWILVPDGWWAVGPR